jgi:hypothetical protein
VFLDRKSPAYLGGAVSFMLAPGLTESFHQLTAAGRHGGFRRGNSFPRQPDLG